MKLRNRITYHLLGSFQKAETRRRWDAQYMQWISERYSRLVQCEMIFLFILYSILRLISPTWAYNCVTPYIRTFSGISPEMYRVYQRRYLSPWDSAHTHVRLMIRYCPCLIPKSRRRTVYNRYRIWQTQLSQSPSTTLHALVSYFKSRDVNPEWYRDVKNLVEFTIWARGRVEKLVGTDGGRSKTFLIPSLRTQYNMR